jgi:LysM repeat protein
MALVKPRTLVVPFVCSWLAAIGMACGGERAPTATMPQTPTAAQPTPTITDQPSAVAVYTVSQGDTIEELASRFGSTVDSIAWANGADNEAAFSPGEEVVIPLPAERPWLGLSYVSQQARYGAVRYVDATGDGQPEAIVDFPAPMGTMGRVGTALYQTTEQGWRSLIELPIVGAAIEPSRGGISVGSPVWLVPGGGRWPSLQEIASLKWDGHEFAEDNAHLENYELGGSRESSERYAPEEVERLFLSHPVPSRDGESMRSILDRVVGTNGAYLVAAHYAGGQPLTPHETHGSASEDSQALEHEGEGIWRIFLYVRYKRTTVQSPQMHYEFSFSEDDSSVVGLGEGSRLLLSSSSLPSLPAPLHVSGRITIGGQPVTAGELVASAGGTECGRFVMNSNWGGFYVYGAGYYSLSIPDPTTLPLTRWSGCADPSAKIDFSLFLHDGEGFPFPQTTAYAPGETQLDLAAVPDDMGFVWASFHGTATIQGEPAPDGTRVQVSAAESKMPCGHAATSDGRFRLDLSGLMDVTYPQPSSQDCMRPETELTFRVGLFEADERAVAKPGDHQLDLHAGKPRFAVLNGTVTIDGESAADGLVVQAWRAGTSTLCGWTLTSAGRYSLRIPNMSYGQGNWPLSCGKSGGRLVFRLAPIRGSLTDYWDGWATQTVPYESGRHSLDLSVMPASIEGPPLGVGLYSVDKDGTDLRLMPVPGPGNWGPHVSVSGDWSHVASRWKGEIHVMRLDGSERSSLGEGHAPEWSADGGRLGFLSITDVAGRASAIRLVSADGSDSDAISIGETLIGPTAFTWSPDGRRLASVWDGKLRVVAGTTGEQAILADAADERPTWSPDGSRVAFVGPDHDALHIVSVDGTGLRTLSERLGRYCFPAWSPDGSRLAFLVRELQAAQADGLYLVEPDNATELKVADGTFNNVAWSPLGDTLALAGDAGSSTGIFLAGMDGTALQQVVAAERVEASYIADGRYVVLSWSPDGSRVAFLVHYPSPSS